LLRADAERIEEPLPRMMKIIPLCGGERAGQKGGKRSTPARTVG
jgi:hypothetical protein